MNLSNRVALVTGSAAFHAIRAALPNMRAKNWGRILNTASTHGMVASVHKAAYVAAKHGIVGLTKVVALEFAAPDQIGAAALSLCSDAAAQIRSIAPPVDGGWTAQ